MLVGHLQSSIGTVELRPCAHCKGGNPGNSLADEHSHRRFHKVPVTAVEGSAKHQHAVQAMRGLFVSCVWFILVRSGFQ